jgi:hypothetical protein
MKTCKIKGRKVEIWEQSFRVHSRKDQCYHITNVLFVYGCPTMKLIEQVCDALDAAYDAGKSAAKTELKVWLGVK